MTDLSLFFLRLYQEGVIDSDDSLRGASTRQVFAETIQPLISAKDRKIARLERIVRMQTELDYLKTIKDDEG